jgi:elongation factor G
VLAFTDPKVDDRFSQNHPSRRKGGHWEESCMQEIGRGARAIALVGPASAGKTSLAEALLFAAGAISRLGSVEGHTSVGDASPEARARGSSTELNVMHFDWMGDRYLLVDVPDLVDFEANAETALAAADLALVVIDPDAERAPLVEPTLRRLEALGMPHALFVNKIDQAQGSIEDLLASLQPMGAAALVARQIPILAGERVAGFVDLALERAYHYQPGKHSQRVPLAAHLKEDEAAARIHMLEQLADHDDVLLEQLVSEAAPSLSTIFEDLTREMADGLVVPVLFGSALNGFGIRRLLKMLRHDTPPVAATAERLGINGAAIKVLKILPGSKAGRLALARVFGGPHTAGEELTKADGQTAQAGTLFKLQGSAIAKLARAEHGDIVAIAEAGAMQAGQILSSRTPTVAVHN